MAIVPTISFAMTDAEFLVINGVAAPTIPVTSTLYGTGATASSSAGTTTLILPAGARNDNNIRQLLQRIRRAVQAYPASLTYTV